MARKDDFVKKRRGWPRREQPEHRELHPGEQYYDEVQAYRDQYVSFFAFSMGFVRN